MQDKDWSKFSKFENSKESPGFLLWKTQITWKRLIEKALITHNLTHPQFVLLVSIAYFTVKGTSVTQVELANYTSCDINTTSQVLRIMEKKGLIIRMNKSGNEKSKYPELTKLGYETCKPAIKTVENIDQEFFGKLSKNELNSFQLISLKLACE